MKEGTFELFFFFPSFRYLSVHRFAFLFYNNIECTGTVLISPLHLFIFSFYSLL